MRSPSKSHARAAAFLVTIGYCLFSRRSLGSKSAIRRLVVFGDDWSDTGIIRAVPLPYLEAIVRDPARGELWAETLCNELACDLIDNFASSVPMSLNISTVGSVIDSDVHSAAMKGQGDNLSLIDLKTQVKQFLKYEEKKYRIPRRLRSDDDWTLFAVFFGLWDLLEYSKLEMEFAMRSVDDSIAELFVQLDVLVAQSSTAVQIVMPQMIDVTFFPRFKPSKDGLDLRVAQTQHRMLFLQTYWNAVLFQRAVQWQKGRVFMPDLNDVVIEHVRMKQLYCEGILDAFGSKERMLLVEDVELPCVIMSLAGNATNLHAAAVEKCSDPAAHLFWDDLHLGPSAHKLIGKQAARLVRGNHTVNTPATKGGTQGHPRPSRKAGERFTLEFPPNQ
ncbi:hypothetical protein HBI56_073300 [Parastagonospora nodorum]|nr:hypothetical protein HBH53_145570 [Parastagonospora nodorum]KAH4003893.1 hypothetical protein HBI10_056690 [Parastagonospora nodorum]KAH4029189.1 hypothetical protein HBI13_045640 [Parastagonospora nodorum]KAH4038088.1 hypothetical protein HBI09_062890 [Parastagonospora nodorum]KAH4054394.1 hypothetical protein HBH49_079700 [Parastagonospora nodorum]